MSNVTFCICTYKRPIVADTIRSICRQTMPNGIVADIVVCDDDLTRSGEEVIQRVAKNVDISIDYIVSGQQNISAARNACMMAAKGDWLALIDDDQTVEPDWLHKILEAQRSFSADVVKGSVRGIYPLGAPEWVLAGDPYSRNFGPTGSILTTTATNGVLISRRLIDDLALRFDTGFGRSGGEDVDFFRRAHVAGVRIISCEDAFVNEIVPEDRMTASYLSARYRMIGLTEGRNARLRQHVQGRLKPLLRAAAFALMLTPFNAIARTLHNDRLSLIRRTAWAHGFIAGFVAGGKLYTSEHYR